MNAKPNPKSRLARLRPDNYVLALLGTVLVAALLPARGDAVPVLNVVTRIAIGAVFFLHGARLSREAIVRGATNWRLHLLVFGSTFVLFPLVGLGLRWAAPGLLPDALWLGLLFLCALPSTVQSSIAFTSIARGNIPAAICSASASNLFGILLTPLLVAALLHGQGAAVGNGNLGGAIGSIVQQLLLPFVAGHLLRPWLATWAHRNQKLLSMFDRGSILLIVYVAFSEAVTAGIWQQIAPLQLGALLLVNCVLLAIVLASTTLASRLCKFPTEDEITIVFCGSKKSLASGMPIAAVLFPAATVGTMVLPMMLFHQLQLMVCAAMAQRYAALTPTPLPQGEGFRQ